MLNQDLLNDIKREMIYSDDYVYEEYYGVMISVYNNIDKYLERVPDLRDKISIAQFGKNYSLAQELISSYPLSKKQKDKYNKLKEHNIDLDETINLRILDDKYSFLDGMLDMIVTSLEVQEQILSLNDEMLELFKMLYERLLSTKTYIVPQLTSILCKMGRVTPYTYAVNRYNRYDELGESIVHSFKLARSLTEEEIDNLLYLYTCTIAFDVKSLDDVTNFLKSKGKFFSSIDEVFRDAISGKEKDISKLQNALLLKTFGIDLISARGIINRYDLDGFEITEENSDLFMMYKAIIEILMLDNADDLIEAYEEFSKVSNPKPSFMRSLFFEAGLREESAKVLNNSVYKIGGNYDTVSGVRIYDAGVDFKMIVTAVGSYQSDFGNQENYSEYWNLPVIRSHGCCCSLIGDNNLSMASVKNIVLGFSTMDSKMLLLSSYGDMNSTPASKKFNIAPDESMRDSRTVFGKKINSMGGLDIGEKYFSPDALLDNTRGDYNELVYERRDLNSEPLYYKKNPDYIVFFEEYEDPKAYLDKYKGDKEKIEYIKGQMERQKSLYQESLKAAKDFSVPIVKINREKCAKKNARELDVFVQLFVKTLDPKYISKIICEFENNRVGNHEGHSIIRDEYFSKDKMSEILSIIEATIMNVDDVVLRESLLGILESAIKQEENKVKRCSNFRKSGQISGIDFEDTLNRINTYRGVGMDDGPGSKGL